MTKNVRADVYATITAVILSSLLVLDTQGILELDMPIRLGIALALAGVPGVNGLAKASSAGRQKRARMTGHLSSAKSFLKQTKLEQDRKVAYKSVMRALQSVDPDEAGTLHFRKEVFRALFPQMRPTEQDYLAVFSLALDYKRSPEPKTGGAIARFIQTRRLDDTSEHETLTFLGGYFRCIVKPIGTRIDSVFMPPTRDEMTLALADIVRNFLEAPYLRFFEEELKNEKDLRRTLRDLATRGEYLATEIGEEAARKISKAIEVAGGRKKSLLLLKADSGAHKKIFSNILDGLPRVGGTAWITDVPDQKPQLFGIWILRPEGTQTVMELADDLQTRLLAEAKGSPGYEAVARAHLLEEDRTFPRLISETEDLQNDRLRACERLLSYFDGAEREEDIEKTIRQVFIPAEDILLKLLPFNLFVADLDESERDFLYDGYPTVKKAFGVTRLTEWENKDLNRIKDYLEGMGRPAYTDEEAMARFGLRAIEITPEMMEERFEEIASEIVSQAGRYRRSLE